MPDKQAMGPLGRRTLHFRASEDRVPTPDKQAVGPLGDSLVVATMAGDTTRGIPKGSLPRHRGRLKISLRP